MSRFQATLAVCVLLFAGCSDDEEEIDTSQPCGLFSESDASTLLGGDVTKISYSELIELESEEEDIPEEDLPLLEAADVKNCVYSLDGSPAVAALQLDRGIFSSVEEYRSAWEDDVEILDSPGLAANFRETDEPRSLVAGVLLNERGDSFALVVFRSGVNRAELLSSLPISRTAIPADRRGCRIRAVARRVRSAGAEETQPPRSASSSVESRRTSRHYPARDRCSRGRGGRRRGALSGVLGHL